jgi:hypothetical protein
MTLQLEAYPMSEPVYVIKVKPSHDNVPEAYLQSVDFNFNRLDLNVQITFAATFKTVELAEAAKAQLEHWMFDTMGMSRAAITFSVVSFLPGEAGLTTFETVNALPC